ncbi:carbohydrate ABC transporter permease [Oceanispirochaeta sp.]|jgi:multiple sugar transport system permease protein|uniref:carbohydrate ABC transporter permease n=1 Tax=Oceanispirochaeta sp. TaxID=2035350 RepID=UPI00262CACFA|nr:carbohydrate ABC transporter permease [Oceanispirochaeta sp.]MDA3956720.1 carbohydrate ABC transporter permease [Oceanispirochaeta sp.]
MKRKKINYNALLLQGFLIILTILCLIPLVFTFKVSMEPKEYAFKVPSLMLHHPSLKNYIDVFKRQDLMLPNWFFNSLFVSSSMVVLQLSVVSLAAYAFARLKMPGKNLLFMLLLFTMMIPTQVTMIPVYLTIKNLKLLDNYLALLLPGIASVFGVFLMRQFFLTIPREFEESAMIDGVGKLRTYFSIMVPQVKSGLIALGIITFLASWNDLFWPLIVMNKLEMRTLPVGLTVLNGTYATERSLVLAGAFIAILPALILYGIFQRKIIEGTMLSGMGGR